MKTDREIVRLYRSGLSLERIGRRVGKDHSWVWRRLKALGEPRRSHKEALRGLPRVRRPDVTVEGVRRLRERGWSVRKIAEHFDASYRTVYKRLEACDAS